MGAQAETENERPRPQVHWAARSHDNALPGRLPLVISSKDASRRRVGGLPAALPIFPVPSSSFLCGHKSTAHFFVLQTLVCRETRCLFL